MVDMVEFVVWWVCVVLCEDDGIVGCYVVYLVLVVVWVGFEVGCFGVEVGYDVVEGDVIFFVVDGGWVEESEGEVFGVIDYWLL